MGTALIKHSDYGRYKDLITDIRDQYGYGIDVYPKTLAAAHDMLEDFARSRQLYPKKETLTMKGRYTDGGRSVNGMMYSQLELVPGTN